MSLPGEIVLHRLRAPGAEGQIVLDGAPAVAMALELDPRLRIVAQPLEVLVEDRARRLVEVVAVVVEVHVLQRAALGGPEAFARAIEARIVPPRPSSAMPLSAPRRPRSGVGPSSWQQPRRAAISDTERAAPSVRRPPRPRHAHARHLTRAATTTPATYHRRFRWSIVSESGRRDRRATACAVRCATRRTPGSDRRAPTTDPRCCRRR